MTLETRGINSFEPLGVNSFGQSGDELRPIVMIMYDFIHFGHAHRTQAWRGLDKFQYIYILFN